MWTIRVLLMVLVLAPQGIVASRAQAAPDTVVLATETFGGGQRLVTGTVRATLSRASTARKRLLALSLRCGSDGIGSAQNIARGTTVTLTPRLLVTDAQTCTLSMRSVPLVAADALSADGQIDAGPVVDGMRGYEPTIWPTRITPGQRLVVAPVRWSVPAGVQAVGVVGDLKTTTCTAVGGSRDNGSPQQCAGHVNTAGSRIRVTVRVTQYDAAGARCAVTYPSVRDVFVDRLRHHVMTYQDARYTLSTASGCTRDTKLAIVVWLLAGSDLVVHGPGTTTALFA